MPKPTEIMIYDPETGRSWYFDTANPDPAAITLGAIQRGLGRARFGCYTRRPITVAEHCLRVARFAEAIMRNKVLRYAIAGKVASEATGPDGFRVAHVPACRLAGLLHDAPEALTGYGDVLRPAKTAAVRESETRVLGAILDHVLGLDELGDNYVRGSNLVCSPREPATQDRRDTVLLMLAAVDPIVHAADDLALYYEAMLWQPGANDWADIPKCFRECTVADEVERVCLPLVDEQAGPGWATAVRVALADLSRSLG